VLQYTRLISDFTLASGILCPWNSSTEAERSKQRLAYGSGCPGALECSGFLIEVSRFGALLLSHAKNSVLRSTAMSEQADLSKQIGAGRPSTVRVREVTHTPTPLALSQLRLWQRPLQSSSICLDSDIVAMVMNPLLRFRNSFRFNRTCKTCASLTVTPKLQQIMSMI